MKKLSIIIPAYNEAATISSVLERVAAVPLPGDLTKEIVIVDDGSSDGTGEIIQGLSKRDGVVVYSSLINLGKGAAVRFGFALATGDVVIVQDADLELDPEQYPDLIQPIMDGQADVVYGSRFMKGTGGSPMSRLANRVLTALTNLLYGSRLTDMETCYKVIRREVLDRIRLRSARFEFEPEITAVLLRLGYRIVEVPVRYHPRTVAQGKKIGAWDGILAIGTLLRYRFLKIEALRNPTAPKAADD